VRAPAARLVCAGCGLEATGPWPFRCAAAGAGDADHVVATVLDPSRASFPANGAGTNPFVRFRHLTHAYRLARDHGIDDDAFVAMVAAFDARVAAVDGRGFVETPCGPHARLGARFGFAPDALWLKDETVNVSGTHKGRHLAAIALHLEVIERAGLASRAGNDRRGLAIASCGNAALAAAVIARATGRPLRVFVPADAEPAVVARLHALGAAVRVCPREAGAAGDPTVHAFRAAVANGAIPFCCQGSENGLNLEGGRTLGWELASALAAGGAAPDRIFVQVGGGALASALAQGLADAVALGALPRMPRLHAVQTCAVHPLRRAFERVRARALGGDAPAGMAGSLDPCAALDLRAIVADDARAAALMADPARRAAVVAALAHARRHRSEYMWPWELPRPSAAHAILDDETYDWHAVVAAMIGSAGFPVVVSEPVLAEARAWAREATGIAASATGSAGLAGLIALRGAGAIADDESAVVLFTGADRAG
jgi:threonine synthase